MDQLNSKFNQICNSNINKYSPAILVTKCSPASSEAPKTT